MKKLFVAATGVAMLVGIYSFKKVVAPVTFNTTAESKIVFVGSKKGGYHPGEFSLKSGSVNVDGGKLTGGKFIIDIAGVKVTDAAGDKLAGHLKGGDFFDAAKYPEATFEITSVKYTSDATADATGNLTLKGVTLPLTIPVVVRNADDSKFFGQATFNLDRTLFGIVYGKGNVSNDVQVSVYLFATK